MSANPATGTGTRIALACLDPQSAPRARELAADLGLECLDLDAARWRAHSGHDCLLLASAAGLALGLTGSTRASPVSADFSAPVLLHRLRAPGMRRQDLARAVGAHERRALHIVDATAGWGRDSAVLAALGCTVTMIERHPVIGALLADALQHAPHSPHAEVRDLATRLALRCADACAVLGAWAGSAPDVVLLDPMFPERAGSAAVRKEMVVFQGLVGADPDAPLLLEAALETARHRVVVKRPRKAPPLAGRPPSHAIEGRSTRFDVYALRRF